jgi:hypothetical protein
MSSKSKNKVSVSVRMPVELYNALKVLSVAESRSLSGQIIHALREWLSMKVEEEQNNKQEQQDNDVRELYFGGVSLGAIAQKVQIKPRNWNDAKSIYSENAKINKILKDVLLGE